MSYAAKSFENPASWLIEQPLLSPEHKLGKSHQFRGRELVLGPPDRSLGMGMQQASAGKVLAKSFADFGDFG
jgi:hypothetical protein